MPDRAQLPEAQGHADGEYRCLYQSRRGNLLVFSPPHMFSPMATISLEFGHIQKGGTPTKLRWLPSHGDPVEEPVGLWVQPDSVTARIMTMCILAGSIDNTVLDEVLKLRPDIETNSWSSLVGKLPDGAEKDICRQVVKSKRVPESFSNISSKYSLLDAMLATIAKVSDRPMLTEWSTARLNAKSELRSIWSAFYKEIFSESDALSEAPDQPTDVVPQELDSESADVLGAISLVNTVDDLSINEEDKLQSLVAEMYSEDVPVEVLLLAASGIRSNILLRLKSATPVEGRLWKGVMVALLKWMRPLRQAEEEGHRLQAKLIAEANRKRNVISSPSSGADASRPSPSKPKNSKKPRVEGVVRALTLDETASTAQGSDSSEPRQASAPISDNVSPPVQQWQAGSGLGKVIVEKSQSTTDRLKPILLTRFEHTDALDSFLGCEAAFGQLSLDYRVYRDMLSQFGEVVMFVQSSKLDPILGGKYRDGLRIRASRDPLGRSDLIEVKELQLVEGLRKIGSHIPQPAPAKEAPVSTLVSGPFLSPSKMQSPVWCLFPPFSPSHAFISMWGWGFQQELGGILRFHSPPPGMPDELREVVFAHAIWGLSRVYDAAVKSTVIGEDDDWPEHWVSAKECVELAVKHRDHRYYDVPEWAAEEFSKRKTLTKVNTVRKKLKTGDYSKVSSIPLGLDASWGRLASDGVPPPTVERCNTEHHRVLICGDRKVSACRIMSPQWIGFTKKVETVGSRHVALLGVPSSPADATLVRSATMACGDTKFHMCTNAVVLGRMGLLAAPVPVHFVAPECVLPLWVVINSLQWGRRHQVLVKSGKAVARHHKEIVDDTTGWWQDVCRVTECDPLSRGWRTKSYVSVCPA